jgi:hypothetical protein
MRVIKFQNSIHDGLLSAWGQFENLVHSIYRIVEFQAISGGDLTVDFNRCHFYRLSVVFHVFLDFFVFGICGVAVYLMEF